MEVREPVIDRETSIVKTDKFPEPLIVFDVAEVAPADKPLLEIPCHIAVKSLIKNVEACSNYKGQLLAHVNFHPFVETVHKAFNDHRPLSLSPDMIWLLISQGLANHINANAEKLRSKFVQHQGKAKIVVKADEFVKGSPENPWTEVFDKFSTAIRTHIGDATHSLIVPKFSTTGIVEKAAAEIVLLDAMQSYFEYGVSTACGIPQIKLEGTIADWEQLLKQAEELAQFDLEWWIQHLIPILEQFVQAAQGTPNQLFWQSIYKRVEPGSGDSYITGWITAFFPYLKDRQTGKATCENRWLIENGEQAQNLLYPSNKDRPYFGLTTNMLPSGLAKAPFVWEYYNVEYKMEFLGGFVGIKQNAKDLCLRPEIGWAVREEPIC